jgi:hypothetical protein
MPTVFFEDDVKGWYNVLLGRDWIHANGCVPSTLHQCLVQWMGNSMEVIEADDSACIAMAKPNTSRKMIYGNTKYFFMMSANNFNHH